MYSFEQVADRQISSLSAEKGWKEGCQLTPAAGQSLNSPTTAVLFADGDARRLACKAFQTPTACKANTLLDMLVTFASRTTHCVACIPLSRQRLTFLIRLRTHKCRFASEEVEKNSQCPTTDQSTTAFLALLLKLPGILGKIGAARV